MNVIAEDLVRAWLLGMNLRMQGREAVIYVRRYASNLHTDPRWLMREHRPKDGFGYRVCSRCGHPECPACRDGLFGWCDVLGERVGELCCDGECDYPMHAWDEHVPIRLQGIWLSPMWNDKRGQLEALAVARGGPGREGQ